MIWHDIWPYLAGASATLAAQAMLQLWIVPRVESQKRRLERWENDVLSAGELLTGKVSDLAGAARDAQQNLRWTREMRDTFPTAIRDPEGFQSELERIKEAARTATRALNDQVVFRSDWRIERVTMYRNAGDLVVAFTRASLLYSMHLLTPMVDDWSDLPDEDFDAWWKKERELRSRLVNAVRHLAYDKRPLRTSWRMRLRRAKYRTRSWWWRKIMRKGALQAGTSATSEPASDAPET
jgi:hypothetical protein